MRSYVSCLLFALVTALLIPISASAQIEDRCIGLYDFDGVTCPSFSYQFLC